MSARLRRVLASGDSGASAVEYGLLVAGIAALIVGIVFIFGNFVTDIFSATCDEIVSGANPDLSLSCDETGAPAAPGGAGTG